MKNTEAIDLSNCYVKDEHGKVLAVLGEDGDVITVHPTNRCSMGMYFYILWQLADMGFNAR